MGTVSGGQLAHKEGCRQGFRGRICLRVASPHTQERGGAPLVVRPPTELGFTHLAGPGAPTWVALKPSLGWTFPICTGTKAVNQSATQSTNDSEAAFSDQITITKRIIKTDNTNSKCTHVQSYKYVKN